ncbi:MAG TPA: hypothetical protein DCM49_01040 [Lachnospiraceae bacterium]|nr:hypothetical protein [Lachnospiraceae bacterium]
MGERNYSNLLENVWPEWKIVRRIGGGRYGTVYEAVRRDDFMESHSAVKIISIPSDEAELDSIYAEGYTAEQSKTYLREQVDKCVEEIQMMDSFKHIPNIVTIEDYKVVEKVDDVGWTIYIRMELLRPLNEIMNARSVPEEEVIKLGIDICSALEACVRQNVIHRDIKPENILVFNDPQGASRIYKLGDFGIARRLDSYSRSMTSRGTPNYLAPEVVSGHYDSRADTYSLGLVLYYYLNKKRLPFQNTEKEILTSEERGVALRRRLNREKPNPPCQASRQLAQVILKACDPDPAKRFSSPTQFKEELLNAKNGIKEPHNHTIKVRRSPSIMSSSRSERPSKSERTIIHREPVRFGNDPIFIMRRIFIGLLLIVLFLIVLYCGSYILGMNNHDRDDKSKTYDKSETLDRSETSDTSETHASSISIEPTESPTPDPAETSTPESAETSASEPTETSMSDIIIEDLREHAYVGDSVLFGEYDTDNIMKNGDETIVWRVLDVQGDKMLLITEDVIEGMHYNSSFNYVTWEDSYIREWLNYKFYDKCFTEEQKQFILRTNVSPGKLSEYDSDPGNSTEDYVFLLNYEEAKNYFANDEKRKAAYTSHAGESGILKNENYGTTWWWLLTPGITNEQACIVNSDGSLSANGNVDGGGGVRPAMWVKIR